MGSPKESKRSRASPEETRKPVWRMTASVPMGEWILPATPAEASPQLDLPEVSDGNWVTSSYDLLDGVRVVESDDTISDPLLDELFGPQWTASKSTGRLP